jgi:hypothetical protein
MANSNPYHIILTFNRVILDNNICVNISYNKDYDKFNIKFNDTESNATNVVFSFEDVSEVIQYLETFINLVVMCHEDEIVSLECVVPGYPMVKFKMSESRVKFPILSKSIACYLSALNA